MSLSLLKELRNKETDKMIESKLGSSNIMTKVLTWLASTVIGPVISFFKNDLISP